MQSYISLSKSLIHTGGIKICQDRELVCFIAYRRVVDNHAKNMRIMVVLKARKIHQVKDSDLHQKQLDALSVAWLEWNWKIIAYTLKTKYSIKS